MARCAAVRLVARAAGLGGGMATFLTLPLVEALGGTVRGVGSPAAGGVTAGPPPPLADARRLLEVLVPLASKPTIKVTVFSLQTIAMFQLPTRPYWLRIAVGMGGWKPCSAPCTCSLMCHMPELHTVSQYYFDNDRCVSGTARSSRLPC